MLLRHLSLRLEGASARQVAAFLLLLQALIFLLDAVSGASISFAPFHSIPVALAAWRLSHGAVAFFIATSTLARVYDYHSLRHDSLQLLVFDLLQSAAFYGLIALLMLEARKAVTRLAQGIAQFRRRARRERHSRRLEATIRRAVAADVPAIIGLTVSSNEGGAFSHEIMGQKRQTALLDTYTKGIASGTVLRDVWGGGRATAPVEFWVSELDGQLAGYMMVLGLNDQKGPERELHALAVDPACRGRGVGTALVNFFVTHYQQRRLLLACKTGSQMMQMAQRRSFRYLGTSDNYDLMVHD